MELSSFVWNSHQNGYRLKKERLINILMILHEQLAKFLKNPTTATRSQKSANKMVAEILFLRLVVWTFACVISMSTWYNKKVDARRLKNDVIFSFDLFFLRAFHDEK